MIVVTYYIIQLDIVFEQRLLAYLSSVPRSGRDCKNIILNATGREVIENGMIRHGQYAVIIFHRGRSIQYRFT